MLDQRKSSRCPHVRFTITPKPADVDEHLKPNTRPYCQGIPRGVAVIPCGACTDSLTPHVELVLILQHPTSGISRRN